MQDSGTHIQVSPFKVVQVLVHNYRPTMGCRYCFETQLSPYNVPRVLLQDLSTNTKVSPYIVNIQPTPV